MQKDECYRNTDAKQCCCQCAYHWEDYFHCHDVFSDGSSVRDVLGEHYGDRKCICGIRRGWICAAPEFYPHAHSSWPEHSVGCECFAQKKIEEMP